MKAIHYNSRRRVIEPAYRAQRRPADRTGKFRAGDQHLATPGHFGPESGQGDAGFERTHEHSRHGSERFILERHEIWRIASRHGGVKGEFHASWMGNSSLMASVSRQTFGV